MLPSSSETKSWFSQPYQTALDFELFSMAALILTQPLQAYERAIVGVRSSAWWLRIWGAGAAVSCVVMLTPLNADYKNIASSSSTGGAVSAVALNLFRLRQRTVVSQIIRQLRPDLDPSFSAIEKVNFTFPNPTRGDIKNAISRVGRVVQYAKELNVSLPNNHL